MFERSPRTPLRTTTEIVFVSKTYPPKKPRRSSFREAQDVPQTGFLEVCRNTPKNTNSWDCVEIHLGTRIQKHEPPGLCRNTPRNTNSSTSKKQLRSFCYCLRAFTISSPNCHRSNTQMCEERLTSTVFRNEHSIYVCVFYYCISRIEVIMI